MVGTKILVVDDDLGICDVLIVYFLLNKGIIAGMTTGAVKE